MPYAFTEDQFCPSTEFIYPDLIEDDEEECNEDNGEEECNEDEDEECEEGSYERLAISNSSELSERMHYYQSEDMKSEEEEED